MLSGHDTTATMLTYALWELGHHPDIPNRVASEVAEIGDRELTPGDVPRLEYTAQVLNESLRLCPPAAGIGRVAVGDIAVDGYQMEAGSIVAMELSALHRDTALWERPLVFDPGSVQPGELQEPRPLAVHPVRRGVTLCIGEHFAMLVTTLALARIIRSVPILRRTRTFRSNHRAPLSQRGPSRPMSTRGGEIGGPTRIGGSQRSPDSARKSHRWSLATLMFLKVFPLGMKTAPADMSEGRFRLVAGTGFEPATSGCGSRSSPCGRVWTRPCLADSGHALL